VQFCYCLLRREGGFFVFARSGRVGSKWYERKKTFLSEWSGLFVLTFLIVIRREWKACVILFLIYGPKQVIRVAVFFRMWKGFVNMGLEKDSGLFFCFCSLLSSVCFFALITCNFYFDFMKPCLTATGWFPLLVISIVFFFKPVKMKEPFFYVSYRNLVVYFISSVQPSECDSAEWNTRKKKRCQQQVFDPTFIRSNSTLRWNIQLQPPHSSW
jgi:hypothetical protein